MDKFTYILGGDIIEINSFVGERLSLALRSFVQFQYTDTSEKQNTLKPAMRLKISEGSKNNNNGNIIHSFDIEGGRCIFMTDGTLYHFLVTEANESKMSLHMSRVSNEAELLVDSLSNFNVSNLKFVLWTAVAFYGIPNLSAAVHSSVIVDDGGAVMFLGESG